LIAGRFPSIKARKRNKGAGVPDYDSIATYDAGVFCDDPSSPQPNRTKFTKLDLATLVDLGGRGLRHQFHLPGVKQVKDPEWESADKCAPDVSVRRGMTRRILLNLSQNGPNFSQELMAQAPLSLHIPIELFGQISFSLWSNDQPITHFFREMRRA
jgi:hypothetical protein